MKECLCRVESRVAWLPKLEDLYRSESQESLPGDHLVKRMMTMADPLGSSLPGAGGCTGGTATPATTVSCWKKLRQHSQTQSVVHALGRAAHASSKRFLGLDRSSTAPACANGTAPAAVVDPGVGMCGDVPAASTALPWENIILMARRAVRHDALRDRLQLLDRRIARRRIAEQNLTECDHKGAWVKHSPQLAAVHVAVALGNGDSLHGGERVHVPTDTELLAMEPVESLRVLRECELRTLSLLTGVKQTWKERVKCARSCTQFALALWCPPALKDAMTDCWDHHEKLVVRRLDSNQPYLPCAAKRAGLLMAEAPVYHH